MWIRGYEVGGGDTRRPSDRGAVARDRAIRHHVRDGQRSHVSTDLGLSSAVEVPNERKAARRMRFRGCPTISAVDCGDLRATARHPPKLANTCRSADITD